MKKERNFISKIFERQSGNALRYRIIYCAGAIIHTIFIVLFSAIDMSVLVGFNVFSVIMYLTGFIFIKDGRWSALWITLFYIEIVAHAVVCGFLLNWSYGFSLYSLMVIPVFHYIAYMDPNFKNPIRMSAILAIINIAAMTVTGFFSGTTGNIGNSTIAQTISTFNFIVCSVVIVLLSSISTNEIYNSTRALRASNDELNFLANYDSLTKLRNRHSISTVFRDYEKGTSPFCVILGDIDDFKRINDTYGHDCGDKVLKCVAELINKTVGNKGVVCRWGGEEILIILSGKSDECFDLMEKIRLMIQNQRLSFERKEISMSMTFGFADYSEAMSIEKLISIADSRLYQGKKNGKNQIVYQKII